MSHLPRRRKSSEVFRACWCLQQDKQASSGKATAFNNGRDKQISYSGIRSVSGHRLGQVNSSGGDIYHQTYCFSATERGEEREISQKASHNKLSFRPSSPKRVKTCRNTILFIISGFVTMWSEDKKLSIVASVCDLKIPLCPNTICSQFTLKSTQRQCQGKQFPPTFMNRNLIYLPLCPLIKADPLSTCPTPRQ